MKGNIFIDAFNEILNMNSQKARDFKGDFDCFYCLEKASSMLRGGKITYKRFYDIQVSKRIKNFVNIMCFSVYQIDIPWRILDIFIELT